MHEYYLFQSLLLHLKELLSGFKNPRLERVIISVGEFSGVDLDYFRSVVETFREGTILESAEIVFEKEKLRVGCRVCGRQSEPEDKRARCPHCGSFSVDILAGLDLVIKRIEAEESY